MKPTLTPVASRQELLELLTDAARQGRVTAIARLLIEQRRDAQRALAVQTQPETERAPRSIIDVLAERREAPATKETSHDHHPGASELPLGWS